MWSVKSLQLGLPPLLDPKVLVEYYGLFVDRSKDGSSSSIVSILLLLYMKPYPNITTVETARIA